MHNRQNYGSFFTTGKHEAGLRSFTLRGSTWKKDKNKNEFSPFVQEKNKLSEKLLENQRQWDYDIEGQNWEARRKREECVTREEQQKKEFWQEKFRAELRVAEQKLEMETAAKETHAKLPKLKITPFKGTPTN